MIAYWELHPMCDTLAHEATRRAALPFCNDHSIPVTTYRIFVARFEPWRLERLAASGRVWQ
eukprot:2638346-Prymnesium_polylepis.1